MADTQQEPERAPGRGINPLASWRAHPWIALVAAMLVLVVGIPFAWIKGRPTYATESLIQVAPRYMRNLKEDQELDFQSNTQYRQFVQHQARSIGRYDVLRDALRSLPADKKQWILPNETERRAVERLRTDLKVSAVPDTYMLSLKLEGGKKEGLAEVVNAVVSTFLARMKQEEIYGSDDRVKSLMEREKELLGIIEKKSGARAVIARDLSLTTFNEATPNPYDKLVFDLRSKLSEARQKRSDAMAAVDAFSGRGDTNIHVRSVQDAVLADPGLNSFKAALAKRRADLLTVVSGLKADHPGRLAATKEIAEIDQSLNSQFSRLDDQIRKNILNRLMGTADQAKKVEDDLALELQDLEKQATHFAQLFQEAMTLTADLSQSRVELDRVRERINYLNIESTSKGFNRLITPALQPDLPFGPGRTKLLLLVLVASAAAGLGLPILRDLFDNRVLSVNDVQRVTGLVPTGWQIEQDGIATELFAKEQSRRLASALIRARESHGERIFGFTGVKQGSGSTRLTLELANTLRWLGYKVLVVEANGFSRDKRYSSGKPGLVELLHGKARSAEVITAANGDMPPVVSVGGRGRVQLDRLDRLKLHLKHWSSIADFVLVDMPPLLSCADAELLSRVVGQVLMVIDAGYVTKREVARAHRLLRNIDPDAVGMVVNRVPLTSEGHLRDLMVEAVSGRRSDKVLTLPIWKLMWESWRLRRSASL